MNRRTIRALYRDLPHLVAAGVLTEADADRLRTHYGIIPEASRRTIVITLFAILGGGLIGSGILLLIGHNWENLGRPTRAMLSFLPLLCAQVLGAWKIFYRPHSIPWGEGIALFTVAGIGAAISLISQTYHISGDEASFFLAWSLLGLPTVYLFNSAGAAIAYFVGILTWAGFAQHHAGHAVAFWPLTALVLPFLWQHWRQNRTGARSAWLTRALALHLIIGLGIALEKVLPGLWTVAYSGLFSAFILAGRHWPVQGLRNPFQVAGGAGALVLMTLLTYDWPWERIGPGYYRHSIEFHALAGVHDYLAAISLPALALVLALFARRHDRFDTYLWSAFPALAVIAYALVAFGAPAPIPQALFNLYMAATGVGLLVSGARRLDLLLANYGMVMLTLLAVVRFFDADLSFILRGVLFIAAGILFLGVNATLVRRHDREEQTP